MQLESFFSIIITISRYLVGINFFFFGLNAFFGWVPLPPAEEKMIKWLQALEEVRFVMPMIKIVEVICGLLLLTNQFTFLATMLLSPIVMMIVLSHLFLNGKRGYGISAFTLIPYLILLTSYDHQLAVFLS